MKRPLLFTLFLAFASCFYSFGQVLNSPTLDTCFFPLCIGNKWQYHDVAEVAEGGVYYYCYYLKEIEVTDEQQFNNLTYYKYDNKWVRYDKEELKAYILIDSVESIYVDFSPDDIHYQSYFGTVSVIGKTLDIFGDINFCIGFNYSNYFSSTSYSYYFKDRFGLVYSESTSSGPVASGSRHSNTIIGFFCADTNMGSTIYDSAQPTIELTGATLSSSLSIKADIKHKYSHETHRVGVTPYTSYGCSFIRSVFLDYVYFNGIDTIPGAKIEMNDITEIKYQLITQINNNLLSQGYSLYYKIIATDKAVIPHTVSYPANGYNKFTTVGVDNNEITGNPSYYLLNQNYPNPFNPTTTIEFSIPKQENVKLIVYDILGKEINTLINKEMGAGNHKVEFNATGLSSGIYFYKLKCSGLETITKKMILAK
ncbi:MAG: T9SS type A sorting domain-containing protein [bacterium]